MTESDPRAKGRQNPDTPDNWVRSEMQAIELAGNEIVQYPQRMLTDANTAIFRPIGDEAFSVGLQGLKGCVCLFTQSHRGVYATHYWETISFDPDEEDRDGDFLQEKVLKPLRQGTTTRSGKSVLQAPLAGLNARELVGAQAFFIAPISNLPSKGNPSRGDPFRAQLDRIKEVVGQIMEEAYEQEGRPEGIQPITWIDDRLYPRPLKTPPSYGSGARGSVIWKFDPEQQEQNPRHLMKLWSDGKQFFQNAW